MNCSPDETARALQDELCHEVKAAHQRYQVLNTEDARAEYLLALKKLSDLACWRIGG
jgi:hypothetical protein